mmetsp:Transcript_5600/g.9632  ORF Transcript_5600/g.9632 Transcript_5600/m.9632 type:complete len:148 (+) Transcript_5600:354-797(+)
MDGVKDRSLIMSGHSFGGSVAQKFVSAHQDTYQNWEIQGQILLSSAINREYYEIKDDGSTQLHFSKPISVIGGNLDGLMRITRIAESYYHGVKNVNAAQKGLVKLDVLPGLNHALVASDAQQSKESLPQYILKNDLATDLSPKAAVD